MKHKVYDLSGALLDAAVAKAERVNVKFWGAQPILDGGTGMLGSNVTPWTPSTDWAQGGPIIERELIDVVFWGRKSETRWRAAPLGAALIEIEDWGTWQDEASNGPTPLIAAMRAYVASKFGEEVELP